MLHQKSVESGKFNNVTEIHIFVTQFLLGFHLTAYKSHEHQQQYLI